MINFGLHVVHPASDEIPVLNALAQQYIGQYNYVAITFEEAVKSMPF